MVSHIFILEILTDPESTQIYIQNGISHNSVHIIVISENMTGNMKSNIAFILKNWPCMIQD